MSRKEKRKRDFNCSFWSSDMNTESSLVDADSTFVLSTVVAKNNKEVKGLPLPEFDLQIENDGSTISDEND